MIPESESKWVNPSLKEQVLNFEDRRFETKVLPIEKGS